MMKALNVRKSHTVVIYECGKGWFASRAAFMLKTFGHPKVFILDGNFAKWTKENRPVESDLIEGDDDETDFDYVLNDANIASYEMVKKVGADSSMQILDSRPAASFANGNIPGSVNVPAPTMLTEEGTMKSSEELQALFTSAGVDISKPTVHSCGGGIMATLALAASVKANPSGTNYVFDGSWAEFSAKEAAQ